MARQWRSSIAWIIATGVFLTAVSSLANAHWLTRLLKEAGDAGTDAGKLSNRLGVSAISDAAAVVSKLPESPGKLALATHITPEGQWHFVSRKGEVFTAKTPDEMSRVIKTLNPEAAGTNPELALYLSENTVFAQRPPIVDLPDNAKLHIVVGHESFPLVRRTGLRNELWAEIRPNVLLETQDRAQFKEALWQLARQLHRADIRILSMTAEGPHGLGPAPRLGRNNKGTLVDPLHPDHLVTSLDGVRGQTIIVTGRVDAGFLHVEPVSGAVRAIKLDKLKSAAAKNDVNLIILATSSARQPGSRNWLWQKIEIDGLKDALDRATHADFLDALGARHGKLAVTVTEQSSTRVRIDASPAGQAGQAPSMIGDILGEIVSHVTGNVVTAALEADVNSSSRQKELDIRIIPGLPSAVQFAYLASLVTGLLGLNVARGWWAGIWPAGRRSEYVSAFGYHAARVAKFLLFLLIFLPLVGLPAAVVSIFQQLWALITLPWRIFAWLFSLGGARNA